MIRLLQVLLASVFCVSAAHAVDRSEQTLGVGVVTQFGGPAGRPAQLSAKIAVRPRIEVSVLFGVRLDSPSTFLPGAKVGFVLVPEKWMNLYVAAAASVDLRSTGGIHSLAWQVGPGIELVAPEWPNVGLALEFGLSGETETGAVTTMTSGFGGAGVHYYF